MAYNIMVKHPVESQDSWDNYIERHGFDIVSEEIMEESPAHRYLKHHHHHHKTEAEKKKKHAKKVKELWTNPGIQEDTVHGLMIDAGSSGSRMHLFEWQPRVLRNAKAVEEAVSGKKLSFPGTDSRWTDRLRPGIASFATIKDDDEMMQKIADYLTPLFNFARAILHEKEDDFGTFPIFFRATAGMRILTTEDRGRMLKAVRTLFANNTFCPFQFEMEQARVLSGEEEAIFGWAGINFVMGNLLEESAGAGTVINPKLTYGSLDMGGASTQISFYENNEDIMSNLFKVQIGQGKHWNIYAHSFLNYGINQAYARFQARLLGGADKSERKSGVYNPCLPGGSTADVSLNIYIGKDGIESWTPTSDIADDDGYYQGVLVNEHKTGNFDACMESVKPLLHLDENKWCDFSHRGECSLAGVYQPQLPVQGKNNFGEFLAFSNYYNVWEFLGLPERASIAQLRNATEYACSMDKKGVIEFNEATGKVDDDEVESFCFRSVYAYQLLTNGYGFEQDDYITATKVLNGQKVGWALGAMLYEINTLPWSYKEPKLTTSEMDQIEKVSKVFWRPETIFVFAVVILFFVAMYAVFVARRRRNRHLYQPIKDETQNLI